MRRWLQLLEALQDATGKAQCNCNLRKCAMVAGYVCARRLQAADNDQYDAEDSV
jgi:hypothetical protein